MASTDGRNNTSLMKIKYFLSLRLVWYSVFLVLLISLSSGLTITLGVSTITRNDKETTNLVFDGFTREVASEVEKTAQNLPPLDSSSSATNLARLLSSNDEPNPSFSSTQNRVAPILFHALTTIPQLSHISYNQTNGFFFSYYTSQDHNQTLAVYSNSSASNKKNNINGGLTTLYTNQVNHTTGELYGEPSVTTNGTTIPGNIRLLHQEGGFPSTNDGNVSLESGWVDMNNNTLLVNRASTGRGATVSMGFPVKSVMDFFSGIDYCGGYLFLATKDGKILADGGIPNTRVDVIDGKALFESVHPDGMRLSYHTNIECDEQHSNGSTRSSVVRIWELDYTVHCSSLELIGVPSVYVLALPQRPSDKHKQLVLELGVPLIAVVAVAIIIYMCFRVSATEMSLRARLIKQHEATQQAERKSLNKSEALKNASHDVRNLLAALSGIVQACHDYVSPGTELASLLRPMELLINDILNILNSVLDASKIEAGKVQLEEEEFDLAELVEEQVDAYHRLSSQKGIDLMLDLCDGSLFKFAKVKGDRTKLMQILSNLLTNAVKFTSEGHVVVRVWAKKPSSIMDSVLSSSQNRFLCCFSWLMAKNSEAHTMKSVNGIIQEKENSVEFTFEVDDTGVGIPKEKKNYVFENYVQVKEKDVDNKGTGLGLGTVQSLVRVMGGEIEIVDKDMGERGTCFRFNVVLGTTSEPELSSSNAREDAIESSESYRSCESAPKSGFFSPKSQASHVVLFLKGAKRREISQSFMERLGIKVYPVEDIEHFTTTLKKIKQKLNLSLYSSSGRSNVSPMSEQTHSSIASLKDVPLSALDGTEHSPHRRAYLKGAPSFISIVIDSNAARFHDISRAVADFRRDLRENCSSIIWLDAPGSRIIQSKNLSEHTLPPMDHVIIEPLHGSRLLTLISLLPEFKGTVLGFTPKPMKEDKKFPTRQWGEIQEDESRGGQKSYKGKDILVTVQRGERQEGASTSTTTMPLKGKKILVVDDAEVMLMLSTRIMSALGANVEACDSGEKALGRVLNTLGSQRTGGEPSSGSLYDYILMDCEMPLMDGFETARRIREAEKEYGVRIPIIALTAHATGEETNRMKTVGMDFHIVKPLRKEKLLEAIAHINGSRS